MRWLEVFGLGTLTTSLIGVAVWFFKWRLRRVKNKNRQLEVDNETLLKILKLKKKSDRKKADAKTQLDQALPRDGSTLDPNDPWRELRERDEKR